MICGKRSVFLWVYFWNLISISICAEWAHEFTNDSSLKLCDWMLIEDGKNRVSDDMIKQMGRNRSNMTIKK